MKKPPLTNANGVCIEFAGRGSFPTGTCYGPCRQMLRVRRSKSPIFMRVVSGVTSLAPGCFPDTASRSSTLLVALAPGFEQASLGIQPGLAVRSLGELG